MTAPSRRALLTTLGLFIAVGAVAMVAWGYVAAQICDVFQISVVGHKQPACPDWPRFVALAVLTAGIITSVGLTVWFAWRRRERRGEDGGI